eukprot:4107937-Karenia_brevis.AAC.1
MDGMVIWAGNGSGPSGTLNMPPPMGKGQRPHGSHSNAPHGDGMGYAMVTGPAKIKRSSRGCVAGKSTVWCWSPK